MDKNWIELRPVENYDEDTADKSLYKLFSRFDTLEIEDTQEFMVNNLEYI